MTTYDRPPVNGPAYQQQWKRAEPPQVQALPSAGYELVTPEKARLMLQARYAGQRKLSDSDVRRWARDMAAGNWTLSPDGVAFDTVGQLVNGQHRLHAIIRSNTNQILLIVRGLPTRSYDAMDTGKKRTFGDLLRSRQYKYANEIAAMVRLIHQYAASGDPNARLNASLPVLSAFLDRHLDINDDLANSAQRVYYRTKFSVAYTGTLMYLFRHVSRDYADEFFEILTNGGGRPGQPAMVLRNVLTQRSQTAKERRMSEEYVSAQIVRAWNAHMRHETPRLLAWRPATEPFPSIYDPNNALGLLFIGEASPDNQPAGS